eukprot:SM000338S12945  [mRNA]  locus=s338:48880:51700:- [translate_table: standard]
MHRLVTFMLSRRGPPPNHDPPVATSTCNSQMRGAQQRQEEAFHHSGVITFVPAEPSLLPLALARGPTSRSPASLICGCLAGVTECLVAALFLFLSASPGPLLVLCSFFFGLVVPAPILNRGWNDSEHFLDNLPLQCFTHLFPTG